MTFALHMHATTTREITSHAINKKCPCHAKLLQGFTVIVEACNDVKHRKLYTGIFLKGNTRNQVLEDVDQNKIDGNLFLNMDLGSWY